jgi:Ras-related protein Rab-1A
MDDKKIEYKVILIGNTAVGKTSLFKKLTSGQFSEKNISTIGMDKKSLQVEIMATVNDTKVKKNVEISLVDTAGQERFRAITKSYFKESDGILLLYDVTNKESFKNVETWIKSIHESLGNHQNSKYIIILIGNKIDLIGVEGKEREVSTEEGENTCKEKDLVWGGECSVKNIEFDELEKKFQGYVKLIYDKVGEKVTKQNSKNLDQYRKKKKGFC